MVRSFSASRGFSSSFTITFSGEDSDIFRAWAQLLEKQEGVALTRREAFHYIAQVYLKPALDKGLKKLAEREDKAVVKTPPVNPSDSLEVEQPND